ncbi:MAG: transglutaminaseTgpA domain-containing protein [Acidimicrobiales bacterium]|nr:transglutaminaseTgpA domain-containing protein [Acidimicrobiales bacterium]
MRLRPSFTTTASLAALVVVAALPLREVFGEWTWAISVLGAAVGGAFVASLLESTLRRLPPTITALSVVAGALVWSVLVSLRDIFWADPVSRAIRRELGDGVFEGWGALLDEEFPLTDPQSAETFAALLTWIAAAAAVHIAARYRTPLAGALTAAGVLWVATAAALPRGLTPAIFGAGAGGVVLLAVATTTRSPDQRWRVGRAVALLLVIIGAATVATIGASASGRFDREPVDPRATQSTETVTEVVPDILAEFAVTADDDEVVMVLDGPQITTPLRLRLQVYDEHNGQRWLPASGFDEIATFPGPDSLPPGEVVTYDVDLEFLPGPWIPLPDRLVSLDVNDIRWNEETQTALETRRIDTYRFTGAMVPRTDLEGIDADRDAVSEEASEVPAGLPDEIRAAATAAVEGADDAIAKIDAITARVRELGRDESLAPGHSFGRLRADLEDGRATGAEQIASLHALMLRAVGIPSRLVVGYLATSSVVESSDLHVWVETALPGVGWFATDPVPMGADARPETETDPTATTTSLAERPAVQAQALPQELGPGEDPGETAIGGRNDITLRDTIVFAAIAIGGLVLLLIVVRVARRQFRHATNRRADVRVLGAWAEFVDRLRELGAPITATTTVDDIVYMARAMDEQLGDEAELLGDLASDALHGPIGPNADDGTLAWEELRRIESTLARVRGGHTIALRFIDPRVLRHRAPRAPASREGRSREGVRTP